MSILDNKVRDSNLLGNLSLDVQASVAALNGRIVQQATEIKRLSAALKTWDSARRSLSLSKINTPECTAAFTALGHAEGVLAAIASEQTHPSARDDFSEENNPFRASEQKVRNE